MHQPLPKGGPPLISHHPPAAPPLAASHTPIMLPTPSNALERSSAQALGLITGYFPWVMSSGINHQDSFEDVHNNYQFIDIVNVDCFSVNWRKRLVCVSNDFDLVSWGASGSMWVFILYPCSTLIWSYLTTTQGFGDQFNFGGRPQLAAVEGVAGETAVLTWGGGVVLVGRPVGSLMYPYMDRSLPVNIGLVEKPFQHTCL